MATARNVSSGLGAVILIITLAILIKLELNPYLNSGPPPGSLPQDAQLPNQVVFGKMFAALPPWVKIWMHFQDIIMGASLFFVLWRKEAQIYAAGIIANHLFIFALLSFVPAAKLTLGFAALSHWFWIPVLLVLVRAWPRLDKKTGYGTWVTVAIAQLVFSLSFDLPHGFQFLISLLG